MESNETTNKEIEKILNEVKELEKTNEEVEQSNEDENLKIEQLNHDVAEGRTSLNNKMVELQKLMT